jgi:hypothetical protein
MIRERYINMVAVFKDSVILFSWELSFHIRVKAERLEPSADMGPGVDSRVP